jgi:hypothetical protein
MLVAYRPGDAQYVDDDGVVFHPQNENSNGNVAYYEITATGDYIDLDLRDNLAGLDRPVLFLYTQWGATDYDFEDRGANEVLVSEQSGFDTDVWAIDLINTSGRYRLTNFATSNGVDGTQAAWLPFGALQDLEQ